jgi:hypothetical protein
LNPACRQAGINHFCTTFGFEPAYRQAGQIQSFTIYLLEKKENDYVAITPSRIG